MNTPLPAGQIQLQLQPGPARIKVSGAWTLAHYPSLQQQCRQLEGQLPQDAAIDLADLTALDTAGAELLSDVLPPIAAPEETSGRPDLIASRRAMLALVRSARDSYGVAPTAAASSWLRDSLVRIGVGVEGIGHSVVQLLGFAGLTLQTLTRYLLRPSSWRTTAMVAQLEQCGLDAVPIVSLLTFMVGAVVAFLGATVLRDFGATVYTVDLVAFAFLREFGVLLTAILLAGRTASAFTAQIGSMRANQEIDAIQTMGLDPISLLVIPRVLALVIALPLLTFIAVLAGLVGGALVCDLSLQISPTMFMGLLRSDIPVRHFVIGMVKAPIFAFVIALIGCRQGFSVGASAASVGRHTTTSVVQSIFAVILLDAVAALFFMEMGW